MNSIHDRSLFPLAPTFEGHWLLGSIPEMRKDRLQFFLDLTHQYGGIVRFRAGPSLICHLVTDPDLVKAVLLDEVDNYCKQTKGYQLLRMAIGQGLLTAEGPLWQRQRRIMQPVFQRQRLAIFAPVMYRAAKDMVDSWKIPTVGGATIDLADEMMRVTLRIVCEALMSTDPSEDAHSVGDAMGELLEQVVFRLDAPIMPPMWLPTSRNRRLKHSLATLNRVVDTIIQQRRKENTPPRDLLTTLLNARDEVSGETMSDRQLRDEVMTLMLAGHETTANALTWTFYLLSQHPEIDRRMREELADVLGTKPPTVEDLPRLKYGEMVLKETMRLYPPVYLLARRAVKDAVLGSYPIPAQSIVFISPYVTHRLATVWENPTGFDPERFLDERSRDRHRFAFIPFSAGPRQCIGNYFAMMEAQLLLATVAQRFRLWLEPNQPISMAPRVTLRPRFGMRMRLVPV